MPTQALHAYTQGLGSSSFLKRPEPIWEQWEQHPPKKQTQERWPSSLKALWQPLLRGA